MFVFLTGIWGIMAMISMLVVIFLEALAGFKKSVYRFSEDRQMKLVNKKLNTLENQLNFLSRMVAKSKPKKEDDKGAGDVSGKKNADNS